MKADRETILRLLKTARGQVDGLIKMVEDDRYCMDISNQLLAVAAVLKKANSEVLKAHIAHCVKEAVATENEEEKIAELLALVDKISK